MAEMYKRFAIDEPGMDFSEEAAQAMFDYESEGHGDLSLSIFSNTRNGYAIGKHWMDVTISMWKEDLVFGTLTKQELIQDYPKWFLVKVGILDK